MANVRRNAKAPLNTSFLPAVELLLSRCCLIRIESTSAGHQVDRKQTGRRAIQFWFFGIIRFFGFVIDLFSSSSSLTRGSYFG